MSSFTFWALGRSRNSLVLERYGVTSFDTTSPLLRAFKDARKNYWVRADDGGLSYYTAIRIPQATENNKLKHKALEGSLNQEDARRLEDVALRAVRAYGAGSGSPERRSRCGYGVLGRIELGMRNSRPVDEAEAAPCPLAQVYTPILLRSDRPWELSCSCRVCREIGVEAIIFSELLNRNKRRGIHNLHVFHTHLSEFRQAESL